MQVRPRRTAGLAVAVTAVVLATGMIATGSPVNAADPVGVDLGAAAPFAVLAGDGVVDTGDSAIVGDVGTYPRPTVSNHVDQEVTGSVHRASPAAVQAQQDLASGYDVAAGARAGAIVAGGALGGRTLLAGVYAADAGTLDLSGTLTLDGRGDPGSVWILQAAADLTTASASIVRLVNGGQSCNVFWQVTGSATLGAGSSFAGSILALTSVRIGKGVELDGRALARNAGVSLTGDTITVPACEASGAAPPAATVQSGPVAAVAIVPAAVARRQDSSPSPVPLVAILLVAAAVLFGEARRTRRPPSNAGWPPESP
jgi:Ice-binding-like